jgi:asparagine synthase (glutamine-hydrolysing)
MAGALYHRGPDEFGLYRDRHAGLAHARLSIIDLAAGQQPLANAAETLWIVFNGEIFNFVELRRELEAGGRTFKTRSDTEVIVQAYEAWGEDAFARMNGQWALALWDSAKKRLLLTRDRLGVRPLYLAEHGGSLYFASEVKAIFAANGSIPRELDPIGVEQTFTFWSVVPPQTVFRGIQELRPGHIRVYENGRMREREFWAPQFPQEIERTPTARAALDDAVEQVRDELEKATELRMVRADVPVGSYLSGGLDSSLVAALGRRFAGDRFQTFSLRFADAMHQVELV